MEFVSVNPLYNKKNSFNVMRKISEKSETSVDALYDEQRTAGANTVHLVTYRTQLSAVQPEDCCCGGGESCSCCVEVYFRNDEDLIISRMLTQVSDSTISDSSPSPTPSPLDFQSQSNHTNNHHHHHGFFEFMPKHNSLATTTDEEIESGDEDSVFNTIEKKIKSTSHEITRKFSRQRSSSISEQSSSPPSTLNNSRHFVENNQHSNNNNAKESLDVSSIWSSNAKSGQHQWDRLSTHLIPCYLSNPDAIEFHNLRDKGVNCCDLSNSQPKFKCKICKMVIHENCMEKIDEHVNCRHTFQEAFCSPKSTHSSPSNLNNLNGQLITISATQVNRHHWLCLPYDPSRFDHECKSCQKNFKFKVVKANKSVIFCSWCQGTYHLECFNTAHLNVDCNFGAHSQLVLPPNWILKLTFRDHQTSSSSNNESVGDVSEVRFIVKPPASMKATSSGDSFFKKPLLVLVNPKSGGRLGEKLIKQFNWYLNPRQVFNLKSTNGPKLPLMLFRNVPNLRILVCGGDGTIGWVLSAMDEIEFASPKPSIAVLPLGTGNDMSRTFRWGGSYFIEPIDFVLKKVLKSYPVKLDRWLINVEPNTVFSGECAEEAVTKLPNNIMNNYFSLGIDAEVCLEFHESREKKESKHPSRFMNLIKYSKVSSKSILKRNWKSLSEMIEIFCDDIDMTDHIRNRGYHCLIVLNLPSYAGGSNPWGKSTKSGNFNPQSFNDGQLELVGLYTNTLPLLQIGIPGERICQAKAIKLRTLTSIPVQVDGEPVYLAPSIIDIKFHNQISMLENLG